MKKMFYNSTVRLQANTTILYTNSRCNIQMREQPRRDVNDQVSWWCPHCKMRKTIREGSFFHKSHIALQKWLLLIYPWVRQYPVTDAAEEAEVDKRTAIDIFQWLREVCSTMLLQTPIVLGGTVDAVQIDESVPPQTQGKGVIKISDTTCTMFKAGLEMSNFHVFLDSQ